MAPFDLDLVIKVVGTPSMMPSFFQLFLQACHKFEAPLRLRSGIKLDSGLINHVLRCVKREAIDKTPFIKQEPLLS